MTGLNPIKRFDELIDALADFGERFDLKRLPEPGAVEDIEKTSLRLPMRQKEDHLFEPRASGPGITTPPSPLGHKLHGWQAQERREARELERQLEQMKQQQEEWRAAYSAIERDNLRNVAISSAVGALAIGAGVLVLVDRFF